MTMTNFEYLLLFFLVALTVFLAVVIAKYIKYKHLLKLTKINVLRRQQKKEINFYAEVILVKAFRKIYFSFSKEAKKALREIVFGRTESAQIFLNKKDKILSLFLKAHTDIKSAYQELKKNKKIWKKNNLYKILYMMLAEKFFDYEQIKSVLKSLKPNRLKGLKKAYYNMISSFIYVKDADMLSASANASSALKFFQKHDMPVEEAETYLKLGEIYRISCVNDVAQTMLESALKIYQKFSLKNMKARVLAVLGMLMVFENRLEEAEDKFEQALKESDLEQIKAEILNQYALLKIAQKDNKKSLKFANEAFEIHQDKKNPRGMALSLQIMAHLHYYENRLKKAVDCTEKAAELYFKQKNYPAVCESLYLQATVLYKHKKYKKAEEILRKILEIYEKYGGNFHHANAYSLLGLIYLKENDLQRAKVLIQQSLHLEQRNDRFSGIAADYANLALIENLRGDENSAKANIKTALEYAIKTEDDDLINLIKKSI